MSKTKKSSSSQSLPSASTKPSATPSSPKSKSKARNSKSPAAPSSTSPKSTPKNSSKKPASSPSNSKASTPEKTKKVRSSQTDLPTTIPIHLASESDGFAYVEVDHLPIDEKYIPKYKSDEAACCDLVARIPPDPISGQRKVVLSNRNGAKIATGMTVAIPRGWKICIAAKSGLAERGLVCTNAPAQIDSDFRGEIMVLAMSLGREIIEINDGERFAQAWVEPAYRIRWKQKDTLPETQRGEGGFGSTGTLA